MVLSQFQGYHFLADFVRSIFVYFVVKNTETTKHTKKTQHKESKEQPN